MQGKEKDLLRQLRELVVNFDPRSELKTAKKPLILNSHSNSTRKGDFCHYEEKANLTQVDTR